MKLVKIISFCIFISNISMLPAQEIEKLPEPNKKDGKPLMQTLNERSSGRDFVDKSLSKQQLSNLLWAAFGINRPESGKRTAPSSHNKQDIDIFVTAKSGTYLYIAKDHALKHLGKADIRSITGKQDFVNKAAVNLIYVSNFEKLGKNPENENMITAATHCGFIAQNVYLYCASEGLTTVFRAWIDKEMIAKALDLKENQKVFYCQSVGYSK